MTLADPRIAQLITLIRATLSPPAGAGRIALALFLGVLCHCSQRAHSRRPPLPPHRHRSGDRPH
jgi:hypothetical protein